MLDRRTLLAGLTSIPVIPSLSWAAARQGTASSPSGNDLIRRRIPGANQQVAVVGIGTARRYADPASPAEQAVLRDTVAAFARQGGQVIDTAPSYGRAEAVIGQLVADLGIRDRLFLATKVGADSREEGRQQIEQSFRNLRTDRIDLIAVHNLRDIANQLATLRALQAAGRVRAVGATTSFDNQYADFEAMMRREALDVIQIDYAIDNRGSGERILPLARDRGMAVMVNLPFGRGRLFEATRNRPLPDWAAEIDCRSWAQIFLKYVISHPAVTLAIPGMAQVRYVEDNMGAARGRLPDAALRRRMEAFIDQL